MIETGKADDWLELDAANLRRTGLLRLIAALITMGATVWLRLMVAGGWVWIVVLASLMACTFWLRSFFKLRRSAVCEAICAGCDGFYRKADETALFVPWSRVAHVTLDEERGAVVLGLKGEPDIVLQDRYGNMGLEDLHACIERRRSACHNQDDDHGEI